MAHLSRARPSRPGQRSGRPGAGALDARTLAIGVALLLPMPSAAAPPSIEQAVKASYIFKFAPFIEWPPGAFGGAGAPFAICVTGQDPFGPVLDDVVRGQKIRGRAIVLRRLNAATPVAGCHIVFMGHPRDAGTTVPPPSGPVLTISDAGSGAPPGMIQFVKQGSRVRFQIDDAAARANGITVSSKLLGLSLAAGKK